MTVQPAPGLSAEWLNAWLAAIGITVLVPDTRLRWTEEANPVAEIEVPGDVPLAARIVEELPSIEAIDQLAIAKRHPGASEEFARNVSLTAYKERAALARGQHDFSLGCSVTDLQATDVANLPHGPFDPPAPRGETLHDRLRKCAEHLAAADAEQLVEASLRGRGTRIKANGLGFDYRRFASGSHADAEKSVDPVVEVLAFSGLAFFPVRGDGRRERTAGWNPPWNERSAFAWPVWCPLLNRWGIDALLDQVHTAPPTLQRERASLRRLGVHGAFGTVAYKHTGQSDVTRAYASERLW